MSFCCTLLSFLLASSSPSAAEGRGKSSWPPRSRHSLCPEVDELDDADVALDDDDGRRRISATLLRVSLFTAVVGLGGVASERGRSF